MSAADSCRPQRPELLDHDEDLQPGLSWSAAWAAAIVTQLVTRLLGTRTIPISGQAFDEVPRSTISGTRSLSQILQPAFLVEQPVQPPARMHITLAESCQLDMTAGARKQIHVPQVCVVALVVGAVALRNGTKHRDCSVPVALLLSDARRLRPVRHGHHRRQRRPSAWESG
ncbi:hypothetical protein D7I43_25305 [Micromonospora globbae]|uniref:Uncharacterized protein n=1 Tax=Micromonospora globbae TaxID=1894969 RepID=A0A420EVI2_9ACTN|nr:hypothetical protein D7I43_25305 [Micromonospora globbae]